MKSALVYFLFLLVPLTVLGADELPTAKITAEFIHNAEPEDRVIYVAAGDPIELSGVSSISGEKYRWKVQPSQTPEGSPTFKTNSGKGIGSECLIYSRPGYYLVKLLVSNANGPDVAERKIYVYTKGEYPKPPTPFDPVLPNPITPTPKPFVPTPFDPEPVTPPVIVVPIPPVIVVPTPPVIDPNTPSTPLAVKIRAAFGTAGKEDAKKTSAVLKQIAEIAVEDQSQQTTIDLLVVARGSLRRMGVELKDYPTFEPILREAFNKVTKDDKNLTTTTRALIHEVCETLAKACDEASN